MCIYKYIIGCKILLCIQPYSSYNNCRMVCRRKTRMDAVRTATDDTWEHHQAYFNIITNSKSQSKPSATGSAISKDYCFWRIINWDTVACCRGIICTTQCACHISSILCNHWLVVNYGACVEVKHVASVSCFIDFVFSWEETCSLKAGSEFTTSVALWQSRQQGGSKFSNK